MKAMMWTQTGVAAVMAASMLALAIAVLASSFVEAEAPTALGPSIGWKCHRLPFIGICDHTARAKTPGASAAVARG